MASEKQAKHLEKAREVRNDNQAEKRRIEKLERNDARLKEIGATFKPEDGMDNWMLWSRQINDLRNKWPALYDKLVEIFGPTPY